MKNRFRMYKGPTCSDEEFAELFKDLEIGGINFTAPTNSRDVCRTFCSCGHCSDNIEETCPVCGKPIMSLSMQYVSSDMKEYKNNYSVLRDVDSSKLVLNQTCVTVLSEVGGKFFDVKVDSNDAVVFHKEGDKLKPEVLQNPADYYFLSGCLDTFVKQYPQYKFATTNDARGYYGRGFTRMMQAAYALPRVYNNLNFEKCGELLGNIFYRTGKKLITDDCQFIVPVLGYDANNALRDYPIRNQGEDCQDLDLKEFLWMFGIPPQIEDCNSYSERLLSYEKPMLNEWNLSEIVELVDTRKWLDTNFGGWLCHLFNNGRFSAPYLRDWVSWTKSWDPDKISLFHSWLKERADVLDMGVAKSRVNNFLEDCKFLEDYGLTVTEDNLREKRINSLRNEGLYELKEYVDVLDGLKKPTELIIKMAAAMA